MAEAYGLDRRIENYQGARPIGLCRWDMECLLDVLAHVIKSRDEYLNDNASARKALSELRARRADAYQRLFLDAPE